MIREADIISKQHYQAFGPVRRTLHVVVPGTNMLTADLPEADEDQWFYGWQVLRLETLADRLTSQEAREARIVYANWNDRQAPMPSVVLLRAAYSNRATIATAVRQEPPEISLPARFVWVPRGHAIAWIAAFQHLSVPIGEPEESGPDEPIRQLRVDLGWISHMFEKRWQTRTPGHVRLNQCWENVWDEMTETLRTAQVITDTGTIHEKFNLGDQHVSFRYDLNEYTPDQLANR